MKQPTLKDVVRRIYAAVRKSEITSHKYYDETYCKVIELRDIAQEAAKEYIPDVAVLFSHVIEYDDHKDYEMSIECSQSGFVYGGGTITACFCGSVEFPRGAYDLCASWYCVQSLNNMEL